MPQSKATWQRHERLIAARLGTRRNGNNGKPSADVSTSAWRVECKSWSRLPAKVLAALHQAERARTGQQTALAVLHQVGDRHDADLVVLRWADFCGLLLGDNAEDRRTRAAVELADADGVTRAILTPDAP